MNHFLDGFSGSYFSIIAVYAVFGLLAVVCTAGISKWRFGAVDQSALVLVFSLSFIGGICGYIGGASRVGAVGDIIPAVIGLLGGLSIYLFGQESKHRGLVASSAAVFSVALFLGFAYGAEVRQRSEYNWLFIEKCAEMMLSPSAYEEQNTLSERLTNEDDMLRVACQSYFSAW